MTEYGPTNAELVDAHLAGLPADTQRLIGARVVDLARNASRGSRQMHPEALTLIPVAAHEETPRVERALPLYLAQQGAEHFELALSLNWPARSPRRRVQQTIDVVRDFQADNPDFPLTFFTKKYPAGTPIGRLRRDLWAAALAHRFSSTGNPEGHHNHQDVTLVNHDIDPLSLTPHYEQRNHELLQNPGIRMVRNLVEYARDPARPYLNNLFAWQEFPIRNELMFFEPNVALSLRKAYLPAGGFDAERRRLEVGDLTSRIPGRQTGDGSIITAHDCLLVTDSRRLVASALDEENPVPPWQIDWTTTSSAQRYRNQPLPPGDISLEQYEAWMDVYYFDHFFPNAPRIAFPSRGAEGTLKLVDLVEEHRQTVGGPEFDLERARSIVQNVIDEMAA